MYYDKKNSIVSEKVLYNKDINNIISFIKKNNISIHKNLKILNLNETLGIWFILNDYNNQIIIPNSFWTPKKNSNIESEIISIFNFFGLSKSNFIEFISNKKRGYRYKNIHVQKFFDRVYLANSLHTFSEESKYEKEELKYIKKSSPLISHQLIIPKNEFDRLLKKFDSSDTMVDPQIIIVDKNILNINKSNFNFKKYCLKYKSKNFELYISNSIDINCNFRN